MGVSGLDPGSPKTRELRGVFRGQDDKSLPSGLQRAARLAALPPGGARLRLAVWAPP